MEQRYTGAKYAADNPTWHVEDAAHKAGAVHRMLGWCRVRPQRVIDVGCGSGDVIAALAERLEADGLADTTWVGWDVAPEAIARAQAHTSDRVSFTCGDLLASEANAELVLCLDVAEHVADDVDFLRRLLAHGETFVFRFPLELSAWDAARPGRMLQARRRFGHLHLYDRFLALEVLREAGYAVVTETYDRVPPRIDGRGGRAMDRLRRGLFRLAPHGAVRWIGGYSLLVCARAALSPR